MAHQWQGLLSEYRELLPVTEDDQIVSLGEGGTPLVYSADLSQATGAEVYVKVEGMNPTGSFKDRGMTMAMTKVLSSGQKMVACASTGNTSASAAAYARKAGLECAVILPAGKIAAGKLAQAIVHGAKLIAVDGNFDQCLNVTRQLTEKYPVALVNSINPYRLQGQKTAAFEIVDALGDAPDIHVLPVGNAGNISAYWMGYNEYYGQRTAASMLEETKLGKVQASKVPQMWGVQAAGAAPFITGTPVSNPETVATAIRIGNPASWDYAVAARDDSNGLIMAVSDEQILAAQARLAGETGIFVEPASAASVAGLLEMAAQGKVPVGAKITLTVTGNGLKDTVTALGNREIDPTVIEPTLEAAVTVLGL